jgi:hypothetical protein
MLKTQVKYGACNTKTAVVRRRLLRLLELLQVPKTPCEIGFRSGCCPPQRQIHVVEMENRPDLIFLTRIQVKDIPKNPKNAFYWGYTSRGLVDHLSTWRFGAGELV